MGSLILEQKGVCLWAILQLSEGTNAMIPFPKKKKIYYGCHNFLSKPSFESHLQDEKGSEASEYLDVFQTKESSHVPPIITSVQPIGEPCMLTTENAGPDPSLLPSHDHTRIETNAPLQCHESEPGHD